MIMVLEIVKLIKILHRFILAYLFLVNKLFLCVFFIAGRYVANKISRLVSSSGVRNRREAEIPREETKECPFSSKPDSKSPAENHASAIVKTNDDTPIT